jgi:hypothetical protein
MFPSAYELWGNGSEFQRPGSPLNMQTIAKFAMGGTLAGLLVIFITNVRGIGW